MTINHALPQAGSETRRVTVLVVDDDDDIRDTLTYILAHDGYEVLNASNGRVALDLIREHKPDLVITDALMPWLDGRELCLRIKNEWPNIRVILMTSLYKTARQKSEAFSQFGVDRFLSKPLDLETLSVAISTLLDEQLER